MARTGNVPTPYKRENTTSNAILQEIFLEEHPDRTPFHLLNPLDKAKKNCYYAHDQNRAITIRR